ncbi:MAG: thiamine-monophosphate kinase [Candidatus Omnitrophica bacterium]|nr:thiamine-monophosphate kinase [Candidatus Omnitrophota bacterium]
MARGIRLDRSVLRGIGDDCAVLAGTPAAGRGRQGRLLLFASDMLVEGVHFRRGARPDAIGWKALAVNVSDVAAMGGLPRHAVVSIGLPRGTPVSFVDGVYRGLRRCAARFGVNLVGGDTVRSPKVVLDVAILGEVERSRVVYRSGARPGDALLVTGRLGGAVRSGRHLSFTPRVRAARALGERVRIHAMMDLSDGLWVDLGRLCRESRVGAVLELERIPRRPGCSLKQALTDGEDFELLLAVPEGEARRLERWARGRLRCGLTRIGRVVRRAGKGPVALTGAAGRRGRVSFRGFRHF